MPAPPLNNNALKHGLRSDPAVVAIRLELGKTRKEWVRCDRTANHARRLIEATVLETYGTISLTQALAINTASRWERHAQICGKLLRDGRDLTVDQRANLSREIARASAERDKAIDRLKLDRSSKDAMQDALTSYYASASEPADSEDQPAAQDAADATPRDAVANTEGPTDDRR